ncbi:WD repeat-containing protein 43-like [Oppia nitens]|uniref:WD repeat-containing protein 43-like n=1 Tax=Oppia nitens TaxID=1686743 RepID=UPI0023DBEAD2|nr:WD repeat-containing protein 43-like [Oppia nitens]
MNLMANTPVALSDCGQYFGYCTLDGQLKVWDTSSAILKQEYTPTAHLSTTCVTIAWPDKYVPPLPMSADNNNDNDEQLITSPRKRLRRSSQLSLQTPMKSNSNSNNINSNDVGQEVHDLELVALGTVNGDILLYSIVKGDLHCRLTKANGGHDDRVNDISWLTRSDSLFSCSNDKQVVEWCISTHKVKKKWCPDKSPVSAICAIDSTNLLIAGNSIKWLDWTKKVVLQTYSGHGSEINRLKHIRLSNDSDDSIVGSYFISSAVGDRLVNVWQLKTKGSADDDQQQQRPKLRNSTDISLNSLASLSIDDEPISLDITPFKVNNPIFITIVTKSGFLYIFEHVLNGHRRTPLMAKIKLQIITQEPSKTPRKAKRSQFPSKQLNILSAQLCTANEVLVTYGSLLVPVFERIPLSECSKDTVLIRKDIIQMNRPSQSVEAGYNKVKTPLKSQNPTVVGPAGMLATRQSVNSTPTMNNNNNIDITVPNNNDLKSENNCIIDNNISSSTSSTVVVSENKHSIKNNVDNDDDDDDDKEMVVNEKPAPKERKEKVKKVFPPKSEATMAIADRLVMAAEGTDLGSASQPLKRQLQQQPSSDSLTHVLVQGLQSRDKKMLDTVFNNTDELVIKNTIKKLPIDCISLFLYELQSCLFSKSEQTVTYLKWLEQLLQLRLTFLMSLPNVEKEFGPLLQLLEARTQILERIYRLKGRLNLMMSQIHTQTLSSIDTRRLTRKLAPIDYESSSSSSDDDDDNEEDVLDDDFKDILEDSDDDDDNEDDVNIDNIDGGEGEDHMSSDESIDGNDLMSEDIDDDDEEGESTNNLNDMETD